MSLCGLLHLGKPGDSGQPGFLVYLYHTGSHAGRMSCGLRLGNGWINRDIASTRFLVYLYLKGYHGTTGIH